MNWIDIIILIIVGLSVIKGLREGLIKQLFFFVGIYIAIFASGHLTPFLENKLIHLLDVSPKMAHTIGMALSFIVILVLVSWLGRLISKSVSHTPLAIFNRLGGAFLGFIIPITILSYIFLFIDSIVFPSFTPFQKGKTEKEQIDIRQESRFYYPIKKVVPTFIAPYLLEKERELIEKNTDNAINGNKQYTSLTNRTR
ncbi:CvpA family protein [Porphyromonas circumdentaria]|uniref:Colicin V production protein n=1 Tax=Porphyromonas circumdentaria TaxID=29524 RepID=A0A1T4L876_9PORP|nr:CvpA family protein [Porphyromonas circumdentaria]MBB6275369.1 putative membrane protein required for colicin V production [Porphyromonas circumdentaria]MDO4721862.1 CvpA family protein [Porphyromonas circumdentaria]SJZ50751.1 Colicin V production protein [Porphyromonas circumdentaria]